MFRLNQTEDQLKQFDREHILLIFTENVGFLRFFRFFSFFFGLFRFFRCFRFVSKQRVTIVPKQTEDPPKQFKREYIWEFFRKFWVVSVCYETDLFVSVVSI
jgi:hypothetical protein